MADDSAPPASMTDRDWEFLLDRIEKDRCTPVLGPRAYEPVYEFYDALARQWAHESRYRFQGSEDLARVAQYLAVEIERDEPKYQLADRFKGAVKSPDWQDQHEPYGVLAKLPLSIYMTTNYDDFLLQALEREHRDRRPMLCLWNTELSRIRVPEGFVIEPDPRPTVANPLVFFCHGHIREPLALVLTEDDHVEWLARVSRVEEVFPPQVREALVARTLLFMGFSLTDWSFRVIFQGILPLLRTGQRLGVAVQLPEKDQALRGYWVDYLSKKGVRVYWGSSRDFVRELLNRRQNLDS